MADLVLAGLIKTNFEIRMIINNTSKYLLQSEESQNDKEKYHILMYTFGIQKDGTHNTICSAAKETQTQRTDFWTQ